MADTGRIRSTSGWVLSVATAVTALIALTGTTLDGGWLSLVRFGAVPLLFTGVVWVIFGNPYVRVRDDRIEICNVFRTVQLSWQTVQDVELSWGLRLVTTFGSYSAWSVPRPPRPKVTGRSGGSTATSVTGARRHAGNRHHASGANTGDGRAANRATEAVLGRWQSPQQPDSGNAVLSESDRPIKRWNRTQLIVLGLLILLSVAGILSYQLAKA